jgi:hypothetical protein
MKEKYFENACIQKQLFQSSPRRQVFAEKMFKK